MQIITKLKNKSTQHSLLLKPRVGDVVFNDGAYYSNISGINSSLGDINNWILIFQATAISRKITLNSSNIIGVDPDFKVDLSAEDIPNFPTAYSVYIDIDGTNSYLPLSPANYNPTTKILSGLNNPIVFPNQIIVFTYL